MRLKSTSFFYYFFSIILAAGLLFGMNYFSGNKPAQAEGNTNKAGKVPDEILVKFKGEQDVNVIKIQNKNDFQKILDSYNQNPLVEYAEPNYTYQATMIPSDTDYGKQWYLEKIKAPEAWDIQRDSPGIIVAILDSGVDINNPDLVDNIWTNPKEIAGNGVDDDKNGFIDDVHGWDFVNNVPDPEPKFKPGFTEAGVEHGTVVAGVAAAEGNNAAGIAGVTWRAQIMPLKVLDDKGEGNTANVIKAIDYAINNGASIINLSFVGSGYSRSLEEAIKRAYDAGVIVVAAAGNEDSAGDGYFLDATPMYPVCYDTPSDNMVIGVAATDAMDQKASFSSYGFKCVDIAAPGVGIYSTAPYYPTERVGGTVFNKYYDGYWSGTSVAAPMVSAAAALIEAVNPTLTSRQVRDVLLNSADNINRLNPTHLDQLGQGRLNVLSALALAKSFLSDQRAKLVVAPASTHENLIKIMNENGQEEKSFKAYGDNFHGGVNIAAGDLTGDGLSEIVTAPEKGESPLVKVFDQNGKLISQFYAYDKQFHGGVNLAVGDVNGDGVDEIITGASTGGGSQVRVFDMNGNVKSQFFAYNKKFHGGVSVAVGDVNGDGVPEIITGAGPGGGPHIRVFNMYGRLENQFFAYSARFSGGVKLAAANIDGSTRGREEIITAPWSEGGPHIRVFTNSGTVVGQFFAFNPDFRGGVNVAAGDFNNDGFSEIVAGAGPGGTPHVRIFNNKWQVAGSFMGYENEFRGGVNAAVITDKIFK